MSSKTKMYEMYIFVSQDNLKLLKNIVRFIKLEFRLKRSISVRIHAKRANNKSNSQLKA